MYSDLWVYETVCGNCTDTCLEGWDHTQFDLSCCPHMGVVSNTWPGVLTTRYSVYYIDSKRLWFCLRWLHPSLLYLVLVSTPIPNLNLSKLETDKTPTKIIELSDRSITTTSKHNYSWGKHSNASQKLSQHTTYQVEHSQVKQSSEISPMSDETAQTSVACELPQGD